MDKDALPKVGTQNAWEAAAEVLCKCFAATRLTTAVCNETRLVDCQLWQIKGFDVTLDLAFDTDIVEAGACIGTSAREQTEVWDRKLLGQLSEDKGILVVDAPEDFFALLRYRAKSANESVRSSQLLSTVI